MNQADPRLLADLDEAVRLRGAGRAAEAAAILERLAAQFPTSPEIRNNLGNALADLGRLAEARRHLEAALAMAPDRVEAPANLALVLDGLGEFALGLEHHRRAATLAPGHAAIQFNLGTALERARRYDEGEAAYRQALALAPDFAPAWHNLGNLLQETGRVEEADAAYRRALALKPDFPQARSSHLMNLHYLPDARPETIFAAHREWNDRHGRFAAQSFSNPPDPERRLRVGYLAAYYRDHPVGFLSEAALSNHDPGAVALFVYVNNRGDAAEARLRPHAAGWRDLSSLSDDQAAQHIRADGIDILVDLAGHTRDHRLGVVAHRPAPIQLHWGAAYWNGTGLDAIDGLITDRIAVPPDHPPPLSETPLYLPGCYVCYRPPDDLPPVAPPPRAANGFPTFGCFNRIAKINDRVVALWGRLLRDCPKARLVLQDRSFDDVAQQARIRARFAAQGVEAARLDLLGALPHRAVLEAYGRVDVALDSFPWSGSIITLESLLMGVPVVTWPADSIAGRHSASLLTALGRPDWIASSAETYCDLAAKLAESGSLRPALRQALLNSSLCDANGFARNLEALYRACWRRWCQAQSR
ncbi:MAG: tetratricopeptide repeat protein [Rhodospirillales bacterium]|nr:tetratricopeptide repeat protein [Rhodospirillales bacterium]